MHRNTAKYPHSALGHLLDAGHYAREVVEAGKGSGDRTRVIE